MVSSVKQKQQGKRKAIWHLPQKLAISYWVKLVGPSSIEVTTHGKYCHEPRVHNKVGLAIGKIRLSRTENRMFRGKFGQK